MHEQSMGLQRHPIASGNQMGLKVSSFFKMSHLMMFRANVIKGSNGGKLASMGENGKHNLGDVWSFFWLFLW